MNRTRFRKGAVLLRSGPAGSNPWTGETGIGDRMNRTKPRIYRDGNSTLRLILFRVL